MTKLLKLLAAISGAAAATLGVTPAFAAGTAADTNVTNQASVTFSVGGVPQVTPVLSNIDTFKVDRVIKLRVQEADALTKGVSPGETGAWTTYTVTNDSNAPVDIVLSASQQVGGAGAHSNTDNFNMLSPSIFVESGANVGYQPLEDLAPPSGYLDEVAPDAVRTIYVVANVPAGQVTGDVAAVDLTAQAHLGGTVGTQGTAVNATNFPQNVANGANTVENVMSDTAGSATGDAARDGKHSAKDDFTVSAAALTVVKTSRVVWDPVNLTSNPKAIPGARVEYCIAVTNAAGGSPATSVAVSDTLVSTLAPYATFGYWTGATVTSGVCSAGTNNGSAAGQVVSGTIGTVAAGTTSGFYFQATVQ